MKNIFFVGRISWHCRGVWSVFISWKPRFNPCCAVQPQGEIMPSLCAKLAENGGSGRSAAAPSPPPESSLNQALALVEKKVRNLEKRKVCVDLISPCALWYMFVYFQWAFLNKLGLLLSDIIYNIRLDSIQQFKSLLTINRDLNHILLIFNL